MLSNFSMTDKTQCKVDTGMLDPGRDDMQAAMELQGKIFGDITGTKNTTRKFGWSVTSIHETAAEFNTLIAEVPDYRQNLWFRQMTNVF